MKQTILLFCTGLFFLLPMSVKGEEITIVGTGSGPSILEAIGEAFTRQHPDVKIIVPRSIGSGGGIKAVGNGKNLIGRVARELKKSEKHYELTYIPIARMPIVFYTNPNVTITNLTNDQACGIYSGKIYNWQELNGHNARIRVIRRQDGDSSLGVLLQSFPNFKNISITKFSKTTHSDPDTIDLAEKTADAIAFGSYSDIKNRQVRVLNIDNISPTEQNYPYYGIFALVFKEKNRTGSLREFIDFAASPGAFEAIKKGGGLPLFKETR